VARRPRVVVEGGLYHVYKPVSSGGHIFDDPEALKPGSDSPSSRPPRPQPRVAPFGVVDPSRVVLPIDNCGNVNVAPVRHRSYCAQPGAAERTSSALTQ
jgi:hypothetical protein